MSVSQEGWVVWIDVVWDAGPFGQVGNDESVLSGSLNLGDVRWWS